MATTLGSLILELGIDDSKIAGQLSDARRKALNAATGVERDLKQLKIQDAIATAPEIDNSEFSPKLNRLEDDIFKTSDRINTKLNSIDASNVNNQLHLVPTVDHEPLEELNAHLDRKLKHVLTLNQEFIMNPLRVQVDYNNLNKLSDKLKNVQSQFENTELDSGFAGTQEDLEDAVKRKFRNETKIYYNDSVVPTSTKQIEKVATTNDIESVMAHLAQQSQELTLSNHNLALAMRGLDTSVNANKDAVNDMPVKMSKIVHTSSKETLGDKIMGFPARMFDTLITGTVEGLGQKFSYDFGAGAQKYIEAKTGQNAETLGYSAGKYGYNRVKGLGMVGAEMLGYRGGLKEVGDDIAYLGKKLDSFIDPRQVVARLKGFEDLVVATLEDVYTYNDPERAGERVKEYFKPEGEEIKEGVARAAGVGLRAVATPFRIRKRANLAQSMEYSKILAESMEVPDIPDVENKKAIALVSGGVDLKDGGPNTYMANAMLKNLLGDQVATVPVPNTYSNDKDMMGAAKMLREILANIAADFTGDEEMRSAGNPIAMDRLYNIAYEAGFNPDSIAMEATRLAYEKKYEGQNKQFIFAGTSAGTTIAEEAVAISERAGATNVKGFGATLPLTGLTNTASKENFKAFVGTLDPMFLALMGKRLTNEDAESKGTLKILEASLAHFPGILQNMIKEKWNSGLMAPSNNTEVIEGAGLLHNLGPFLANEEFQSRLSDFLGMQLSEDAAGRPGQSANKSYADMFGELDGLSRTLRALQGDQSAVDEIKKFEETDGKQGGYAFVTSDLQLKKSSGPAQEKYDLEYALDNFRNSGRGGKAPSKQVTGQALEDANLFQVILEDMINALKESSADLAGQRENLARTFGVLQGNEADIADAQSGKYAYVTPEGQLKKTFGESQEKYDLEYAIDEFDTKGDGELEKVKSLMQGIVDLTKDADTIDSTKLLSLASNMQEMIDSVSEVNLVEIERLMAKLGEIFGVAPNFDQFAIQDIEDLAQGRKTFPQLQEEMKARGEKLPEPSPQPIVEKESNLPSRQFSTTEARNIEAQKQKQQERKALEARQLEEFVAKNKQMQQDSFAVIRDMSIQANVQPLNITPIDIPARAVELPALAPEPEIVDAVIASSEQATATGSEIAVSFMKGVGTGLTNVAESAGEAMSTAAENRFVAAVNRIMRRVPGDPDSLDANAPTIDKISDIGPEQIARASALGIEDGAAAIAKLAQGSITAAAALARLTKSAGSMLTGAQPAANEFIEGSRKKLTAAKSLLSNVQSSLSSSTPDDSVIQQVKLLSGDEAKNDKGYVARLLGEVNEAIAQLSPADRTKPIEGTQLANLKSQIIRIDKELQELATFLNDIQAQDNDIIEGEIIQDFSNFTGLPASPQQQVRQLTAAQPPPNYERMVKQTSDDFVQLKRIVDNKKGEYTQEQQQAAASEIARTADDAYKAINDLQQSLGDRATTPLKNLASAAKGQISKARSSVEKSGIDVSGVSDQTADLGRNVADGFPEGFSDRISSLKAESTRLINGGIIDPMAKGLQIKSPSRLTTGYGENTVQGFINGIKNKFGDLKSTIAEVKKLTETLGVEINKNASQSSDYLSNSLSKILSKSNNPDLQKLGVDKNKLKSLFSQGYGDIGGNLTSSLASGIDGGEVIQTVEVMAVEVVDAIKKEWEIASPSKKGFNLGRWLAEGIKKGIEATLDISTSAAQVTKDLYSMADMYQSNLRKAFDSSVVTDELAILRDSVTEALTLAGQLQDATGAIQNATTAVGRIINYPNEAIVAKYKEDVRANASRVLTEPPDPDTHPAAHNIPADAKKVIFVSSGFTGTKGRISNEIAGKLEPMAPQGTHMVPFENKNFDVSGTMDDVGLARVVMDAIIEPMKAVKNGVNEEALRLAKQAYAVKQQRPDVEIGFVGHSAGGLIVREAQEILRGMEIFSQALSMGTPLLGAFQAIKPNTVSLMGDNDQLRRFTGQKEGIVPGVEGHFSPFYLDESNEMREILTRYLEEGITPGLIARIHELGSAIKSLQPGASGPVMKFERMRSGGSQRSLSSSGAIDVSAVEVGKPVGSALAQGIDATGNEAVEASSHLAIAVIDKMKDEFDMHSPPRVFVAIGEAISQALASGMESARNLVGSAAGKVAETAEGAFSGLKPSSIKKNASEKFNNWVNSPTEDDFVPIEWNTKRPEADIPIIGGAYSMVLDSLESMKNMATALPEIGRGLAGVFEGVMQNTPAIMNMAKGFLVFNFIVKPLIATLAAFEEASFNVAVEMQNMTNVIELVSGSAAEGAKNIAFIREQVSALGGDMKASMQGFSSLGASAQGTRLEGEGTRQIFSAVAQASTVYQMDPEEQGRAYTALSQMMDKSVVSAEELRGQLAESLPGAIAVAARAMGVSTQELGKMMEMGEVMAEDLLPRFAQQLSAETAGGLAGSAKTAQSSINKLNNEMLLLQEAYGMTSIPIRVAGMEAASTGLKLIRENILALSVAVTALVVALLKNAAIELIKFLAKFAKIEAVMNLIRGAATKLFTAIIPMIKQMGMAFLKQFLLLTAIGDVFTIVSKGFGDASGGMRDTAKSTTDAWKSYINVLEAAKKKQEELEKGKPQGLSIERFKEKGGIDALKGMAKSAGPLGYLRSIGSVAKGLDGSPESYSTLGKSLIGAQQVIDVSKDAKKFFSAFVDGIGVSDELKQLMKDESLVESTLVGSIFGKDLSRVFENGAHAIAGALQSGKGIMGFLGQRTGVGMLGSMGLDLGRTYGDMQREQRDIAVGEQVMSGGNIQQEAMSTLFNAEGEASGDLKRIIELDEQYRQTQQRRSALPREDVEGQRAAEQEINRILEERGAIYTNVGKQQANLQLSVENYKSQIKSVEEELASLGNSDKDNERRTQLEGQLAALKSNMDGSQKLLDNINTKLGEAANRVELLARQFRAVNAELQNANYSLELQTIQQQTALSNTIGPGQEGLKQGTSNLLQQQQATQKISINQNAISQYEGILNDTAYIEALENAGLKATSTAADIAAKIEELGDSSLKDTLTAIQGTKEQLEQTTLETAQAEAQVAELKDQLEEQIYQMSRQLEDMFIEVQNQTAEIGLRFKEAQNDRAIKEASGVIGRSLSKFRGTFFSGFMDVLQEFITVLQDEMKNTADFLRQKMELSQQLFEQMRANDQFNMGIPQADGSVVGGQGSGGVVNNQVNQQYRSTLAAQKYNASRGGGSRRHAGEDFDISGANANAVSFLGGRVTRVANDPGGYGQYVDVFNESLGVVERIAEFANGLVKVGDTIAPGQAVGRGETQTGVIHYEVRKDANAQGQGGYGHGGTVDPIQYLNQRGINPYAAPDQVFANYQGRTNNQITSQLGQGHHEGDGHDHGGGSRPQQQSGVQAFRNFGATAAGIGRTGAGSARMNTDPNRPDANLSQQVRQAYASRDTRGITSAIVAEAMRQGITDQAQVSYIVATAMHESDNYRTLEEYASGSAYEGRGDLGNTQRGDGQRFKGRGFVQITGRNNYQKYSNITGQNLVANPEAAEDPATALFTLVHGMRTGAFTGRGIGQYGSGSNFDAVNARRTVNGTDRAQHIANIARNQSATVGNIIQQVGSGGGFSAQPQQSEYERFMREGYALTQRGDNQSALINFRRAAEQRPNDRYATQAIQNVTGYIGRSSSTSPTSAREGNQTSISTTPAVQPVDTSAINQQTAQLQGQSAQLRTSYQNIYNDRNQLLEDMRANQQLMAGFQFEQIFNKFNNVERLAQREAEDTQLRNRRAQEDAEYNNIVDKTPEVENRRVIQEAERGAEDAKIELTRTRDDAVNDLAVAQQLRQQLPDVLASNGATPEYQARILGSLDRMIATFQPIITSTEQALANVDTNLVGELEKLRTEQMRAEEDRLMAFADTFTAETGELRRQQAEIARREGRPQDALQLENEAEAADTVQANKSLLLQIDRDEQAGVLTPEEATERRDVAMENLEAALKVLGMTLEQNTKELELYNRTSSADSNREVRGLEVQQLRFDGDPMQALLMEQEDQLSAQLQEFEERRLKIEADVQLDSATRTQLLADLEEIEAMTIEMSADLMVRAQVQLEIDNDSALLEGEMSNLQALIPNLLADYSQGEARDMQLRIDSLAIELDYRKRIQDITNPENGLTDEVRERLKLLAEEEALLKQQNLQRDHALQVQRDQNAMARNTITNPGGPQALAATQDSYMSMYGLTPTWATKQERLPMQLEMQQLDYQDQLVQLEELKNTGLLTEEAYKKAGVALASMNEINLDRIKKEASGIPEIIGAVKGNVSGFFKEMLDPSSTKTFGEAFGDMVNGILSNLANLAAEWVTNALFSSFLGGGAGSPGKEGGLFGSLFAPPEETDPMMAVAGGQGDWAGAQALVDQTWPAEGGDPSAALVGGANQAGQLVAQSGQVLLQYAQQAGMALQQSSLGTSGGPMSFGSSNFSFLNGSGSKAATAANRGFSIDPGPLNLSFDRGSRSIGDAIRQSSNQGSSMFGNALSGVFSGGRGGALGAATKGGGSGGGLLGGLFGGGGGGGGGLLGGLFQMGLSFLGMKDGGNVAKDGFKIHNFAGGGALQGISNEAVKKAYDRERPHGKPVLAMLNENEWVLNRKQQAIAKSYGVDEKILNFSGGGAIGGAMPSPTVNTSNVGGSTSVSVPITVQAGDGGKKEDAEGLAKKLKGPIEALTMQILQREQRFGGQLSR